MQAVGVEVEMEVEEGAVGVGGGGRGGGGGEAVEVAEGVVEGRSGEGERGRRVESVVLEGRGGECVDMEARDRVDMGEEEAGVEEAKGVGGDGGGGGGEVVVAAEAREVAEGVVEGYLGEVVAAVGAGMVKMLDTLSLRVVVNAEAVAASASDDCELTSTLPAEMLIIAMAEEDAPEDAAI
ncbi:hypothetical protein CYMTET_19518 [Cymbomonas tetramitiformis]|uniref:Uncharacterized protein n=1 Tax=Cymbomonas tetramitiformis TaxID=36881 RepID=A0AAE0G789_9CHLO|nr:hypothetical protein CYMTET_19518 [Cymbomonas tetramitiformis]